MAVGGGTFFFFFFFKPISAIGGATKKTTENDCRIRKFILRILKAFSWGAQVWGYGALVNSTTPIRGNGIAKTRAFCIWLPVHKMFIVMIKANTIHGTCIIKLMV